MRSGEYTSSSWKAVVASRPSKGNTCTAEMFKATFPSWQGSPQLPSRIAFASALRLTFGTEWLNHKMKDGLLCGVSLFTLSPSCPLGEWCQRAPKAKDDLSVNCQLLPHHYKYKIKPQILKGPSLFTCISVWFTTKMVKGSIKFHSKPSSILTHQTALATVLWRAQYEGIRSIWILSLLRCACSGNS